MEELKEYEVWTEGYAATGESSGAICHTVVGADYMHGKKGTPVKIKAASFIEACKQVLGGSLDSDGDGNIRLSQNKYPTQDGEINVPMVWACLCFDNEKQARKSFG
jgi:hypothetical protein